MQKINQVLLLYKKDHGTDFLCSYSSILSFIRQVKELNNCIKIFKSTIYKNDSCFIRKNKQNQFEYELNKLLIELFKNKIILSNMKGKIHNLLDYIQYYNFTNPNNYDILKEIIDQKILKYYINNNIHYWDKRSIEEYIESNLSDKYKTLLKLNKN
jgi:hypothetical protein